MTEAPEKIWAYAGAFRMWRSDYPSHANNPVEYIRADVSDALVAAAREEALREAYQNLRTFAPHHEHNTGLGYESGYHTAMNRILALITKDAE